MAIRAPCSSCECGWMRPRVRVVKVPARKDCAAVTFMAKNGVPFCFGHDLIAWAEGLISFGMHPTPFLMLTIPGPEGMPCNVHADRLNYAAVACPCLCYFVQQRGRTCETCLCFVK